MYGIFVYFLSVNSVFTNPSKPYSILLGSTLKSVFTTLGGFSCSAKMMLLHCVSNTISRLYCK
jgi:hypothetical protein